MPDIYDKRKFADLLVIPCSLLRDKPGDVIAWSNPLESNSGVPNEELWDFDETDGAAIRLLARSFDPRIPDSSIFYCGTFRVTGGGWAHYGYFRTVENPDRNHFAIMASTRYRELVTGRKEAYITTIPGSNEADAGGIKNE